MSTNRLFAILKQVQRLLRKHEDVYCLPVINELLDQYHGDDTEFREQVAKALFSHHGMGSVSDLSIMKVNRHKVTREREVNIELQALFNVAHYEAIPPSDDKRPLKHFDRYPTEHSEWESALTSSELEPIVDVLIFLTYRHADWQWVAAWCIYFTFHSSQDVRMVAIRCLVDIAGFNESFYFGLVITRLGELMKDRNREVRAQAVEAAIELNKIPK